MINNELKQVITQNIQRGWALAEQETWSPFEAQLASRYDCPSIARIAAGLRSGFSGEEESQARASADFQKMVRFHWQRKPVTFWMLARSLAEGESFPFAPALRQHLEEPEGAGARIAISSPITKAVAEVLRTLDRAGAAFTRLQKRVLDWEAGTLRFSLQLPAFGGAFDTEAKDPFERSEQDGNGLSVRLEEVIQSDLRLSASAPAHQAAGVLHVTLRGETGNELKTELQLTPAVEYAGGQTRLGAFRETREQLGEHCLVLVSAQPMPDLKDFSSE